MVESKDKIHVLFDTDTDGYIVGWQQEFYDGKAWQTPFDTTNAVEVTPAALDNIIIGATRYTDGQLVTDEAKREELENPVPQPTPEQQMLAALALKLAKLEAG
ncbi:phage infection protein [Lacticaseibacillus parakribbianus]|uniref:phage infection protein n=1 Tax=Lacticaseibacillus parakribbianus TaxID=2970927 RepID=UPI0021CB6C3B|nr:phage infection protein [Lacticaseibacillus parakribbianus]